MGDEEYSKPTNCLRWFFAFCNIVFLLCGCLTVAIGLWGVVVAVDGDYATLTGDNLILGAVLLLVAGGVTIIISIIGFCGAAGMWRAFLVIYAAAVCVIVAIEIAGAISAFVFTDEASERVRENMLRAIINYRFSDVNSTAGNSSDFDAATNSAVETVQDFFECCGVDNYTDWIIYNPNAVIENTLVPPARCFCDKDESNCHINQVFTVVHTNGTEYVARTNVWDRGCLSLLEDSLENTGLINGVIGVVIAVIELAFAMMAICLCGAVHKHYSRNRD